MGVETYWDWDWLFSFYRHDSRTRSPRTERPRPRGAAGGAWLGGAGPAAQPRARHPGQLHLQGLHHPGQGRAAQGPAGGREEVFDVSYIFSLLFVCDVTQQKLLWQKTSIEWLCCQKTILSKSPGEKGPVTNHYSLLTTLEYSVSHIVEFGESPELDFPITLQLKYNDSCSSMLYNNVYTFCSEKFTRCGPSL